MMSNVAMTGGGCPDVPGRADDCPRCTDVVAAILDERADATCPDCGAAYRWRGSVPDARVRVATAERLRPSTVPPVARLTHVEDGELVRVRRLLCELRPDKGGPLGWAADGAAPAAGGSNWTPALRVQTSVEVPAILPGAFATAAPASRAPDLDRGFPGMPEDVRATLRWCQRTGTIARGLRAFYADAAQALAPTETRAAWKALPAALQVAAVPGYGRKRVTEAMAAWWSDVPEAERPSGVHDAVTASAATGAALAEMRERMGA